MLRRPVHADTLHPGLLAVITGCKMIAARGKQASHSDVSTARLVNASRTGPGQHQGLAQPLEAAGITGGTPGETGEDC